MTADPRQRIADVAALWSVDRASHEEVVTVAADALAAGLDSISLRDLAGVFRAEAYYMVPELLPLVLRDLSLPYAPRGSPEGKISATRVVARQCIDGVVSPRELARWMHQTIGHGDESELEALVVLDDCYDELQWAAETEADIDNKVIDACHKVLGADPSSRA